MSALPWYVDLEHDDCDHEDGGDTEPNGDEHDMNGDEHDTNHAEDELSNYIGNGLRFVPADAEAVREARKRLSAIMDRVGGRG